MKDWLPARIAIASAMVATLLLVLLFVLLLMRTCSKSGIGGLPPVASSPREEQLPPQSEIDHIVERTNERLTISKIRQVGVLIEGEQPQVRYTIESDDPNFYFPATSYVIGAGSVRAIPTAGICQVIEEMDKFSSLRISDALDKINFEGQVSPAGPTLKISGPLKAFLEQLFAVHSLTKIHKKRAVVFVRGYADGKAMDWKKDLDHAHYHFDKISVLFPILEQRNSLNPVTFLSTPEEISIPEKYGNQHLPDLRAAFFKQDFLEPFLKQCTASSGPITVNILKGYEFRDAHNEKERRVDVQVDLY